jgi:hypothetical protein
MLNSFDFCLGEEKTTWLLRWLFNEAFSAFKVLILQLWQLIVHDELGMTWKKVVVVYCKVINGDLSQY